MKILTKFVYQSSLAATQSPVTSMFVCLHATSVTSAWRFFYAHQIDCFQVSFGGGLGGLVVDTIGHKFSQKYHNRVIQVRFILLLVLTIILFLIAYIMK